MWGRCYIMGRGEAWSVRVTAPCHGDGSASWRRLTWSPGHHCHCVTRDHSSGHNNWPASVLCPGEKFCRILAARDTDRILQGSLLSPGACRFLFLSLSEARVKPQTFSRPQEMNNICPGSGAGMLTTENLEYIDPVECCGNELTSLLHGSSPLVNLDWGLSNWEISNIQSPKTRAGGYSCLYGQP